MIQSTVNCLDHYLERVLDRCISRRVEGHSPRNCVCSMVGKDPVDVQMFLSLLGVDLLYGEVSGGI
jgi:hypothetical protein